ncbi:hypothetical protein TorRG33x02_188080 [Trema orientale]|uniref:Uncharacterized protein n=1 Tax=Trema orientale TaxID=63057 RepID=A0A2P5EIL7_TREOI|nr:hypothetical protein TorRG33x02_188080 [Trema orientale]
MKGTSPMLMFSPLPLVVHSGHLRWPSPFVTTVCHLHWSPPSIITKASELSKISSDLKLGHGDYGV